MSNEAPGTFASVDRFLTVAQVLKDKRSEELVKENNRLKLEIFWKKYTVQHIHSVFKEMNWHFNFQMTGNADDTLCYCTACCALGKTDDPHFPDALYNRPCKLQPVKQEIFNQCGLTVVQMNKADQDLVCHRLFGEVSTADAHFVFYDEAWCDWNLGAKFWKRKCLHQIWRRCLLSLTGFSQISPWILMMTTTLMNGGFGRKNLQLRIMNLTIFIFILSEIEIKKIVFKRKFDLI